MAEIPGATRGDPGRRGGPRGSWAQNPPRQSGCSEAQGQPRESIPGSAVQIGYRTAAPAECGLARPQRSPRQIGHGPGTRRREPGSAQPKQPTGKTGLNEMKDEWTRQVDYRSRAGTMDATAARPEREKQPQTAD